MRRADSYQDLLGSLRPGDGLILIDMDDFGEVNTTFGQAEGDRLLDELTSHLRGVLRGKDAVVRFGGDGFMAVIRGAGEDSLPAACRLSHSWRTLNPLTTFSAGVAVHEGDAEAEQTFSDADTALYEAKQRGPGQVSLSRARGVAPNPGLHL